MTYFVGQRYGIENEKRNRKIPTRQMLDQFLSEQDLQAGSLALYGRTLKQYFAWLQAHGWSWQEANAARLLLYKRDLQARGLSALSVANYLASVRRFYAWAAGRGLIGDNPASALRSSRRLQRFRKQPLSIAQSALLLEYAQKHLCLRDYALLNLLLRTGLRTIEASRAQCGDLAWRGGRRILRVQGKGRLDKDNFVVLTDKTYLPLKTYLDSRPERNEGSPLFASHSPNAQGRALTTRSISAIAKRALQAIGLDELCFTAHSLRHTAAVHILRAGGTVFDAQGMLRHQSPGTTQIYTAVLDEELRLQHSPESLMDTLF